MEYLVRLIGRRLEQAEGRIGYRCPEEGLGFGIDGRWGWSMDWYRIGMVWIGMVFFTPGRAKVYQT